MSHSAKVQYNEKHEKHEKHEKPIIVRRMHFKIDEEIPRFWHSQDPFKTHLFNALSAHFPVGEKYFINTVRSFENVVNDDLKKDIKLFIGQEANHTRVHKQYNQLLTKRGYRIQRMEKTIERNVKLSQRFLSKKTQLAQVVAIEHLTAILADAVLSQPEWLQGAHPEYQNLWHWHCVEEIEHKAVAYQVYRQVGGGYWRRVTQMFVVTIPFLFNYLIHHLSMLWSDRRLFNPGRLASGVWFLWGKPGIFRKLIPVYLQFFSPSFHPDNHQNRNLVYHWRKKNPKVFMVN